MSQTMRVLSIIGRCHLRKGQALGGSSSRGFLTSTRQPIRGNALRLAKDIASRIYNAGIRPPEFAQMVRPLKQIIVANEVDKDHSQSFNDSILNILAKATKESNLSRLHHSTKEIGEILATFTRFGISEAMARDILHNNPKLLALNAEDISEICHELQLSGVDMGDFASILSQHSLRCGSGNN